MTLHVHRRKNQRKTIHYRILFRGMDVSHRCTRFDTRRKRAWLFDVTRDGDYIISPDGTWVQGRWHYGRITVSRGPVPLHLIRARYRGEGTPRWQGPAEQCCHRRGEE